VKFILKILLLLIFALPLFAKQPSAGSRAINFTLYDFEGTELTLRDFKGKVVLLDFWASWCVPCREELPMLNMLQKKYGRHGFEVVAVNIDNKRENAIKFLQQYNITLKSVWDQKKEVVSMYDVATMPTTFIIDQRGIIRFVHSGFEAENLNEYRRQIESLLAEKNRRRNPKRPG